ncbi:Crp/Fnr family transcriptional regulator [Acidipila sp. EB88]|uniref:Crp/Fnr family transcriptional regulator n=1 Tax=Acidipila sp. EB88 TaxID=2305226 RepID=UPI001F3ACC20|nr:Crp/Fnr family transcriptional regulator [Acidipila sp. EB88]
MTGCEGVVGAIHLLGPNLAPTECFMQIAGTALRIPLTDLQACFDRSPEIRARLLENVQEQTMTQSQIAACHRLHDAEARLSRWLLMAQDRVGGDTLELTQEVLAQMLGTGRPTVTLIAGSLQRAGLIEARRGRVTVLNRAALERASCECYRVVHKLVAGLYKPAYMARMLHRLSQQPASQT